MADHDNDIPPWERDDWDSSDDPSFESSTAPVGNQLSSRRLRGAHVGIAAGVGAILLIGGVVALVDTTDRQAVGTADSVPASVASTDSAPTTTVGGGVPVFWNAGGVETSDSVAIVTTPSPAGAEQQLMVCRRRRSACNSPQRWGPARHRCGALRRCRV